MLSRSLARRTWGKHRSLGGYAPAACWLRLALVVVAAVARASATSASSLVFPSGTNSSFWSDICRLRTFQEARVLYLFPDFAEQCERHVCPLRFPVDFTEQCLDHSLHSFDSEFVAMQSTRQNLQWPIAYLCLAILIGAFCKRFLPSSIPFTVGLLGIGILAGIFSANMLEQSDCPMYALVGDDDGRVTRAEYDIFICASCVRDSFCLSHPTPHGKERTCAAAVGGCQWSFDELHSTWKQSSMLVEQVGLSDMQTESLSADQLWRARCNLLDDLLSLSSIQPHLLLLIFLPGLLFESACFGLDIGVFRKQMFQIGVLAFPAMVISALVTGALLFALAPPSWSFWPCFLIGSITAATDPVAVTAVVKELGASKALGAAH